MTEEDERLLKIVRSATHSLLGGFRTRTESSIHCLNDIMLLVRQEILMFQTAGKFFGAPMFILIIWLLLIRILAFDAFATSPYFGYQQLVNDPYNWIDIHKHAPSPNGDPATGIQGVTYSSNGKILNATLWLLVPFDSSLSKDRGQINYGMFIDADANKKTGVGGIDYQIEISGQNGKWTKTFSQWTSYNSTQEILNRTLSKIDNYTGFFAKNGQFVLLSLDLNAIGSPDRYRLLFYAEQIRGSTWLSQFTNWISIPQPEFHISTLQPSVDITQGSQKTVQVQIKSTTGFEPVIHLYTNQKNVNLKFNPPQLFMPSYGVNTTELSIVVPQNLQTGLLTANIFAYATFPNEPFIFYSSKSSNNAYFPTLKLPSQIVTNQTSIMINVQDPIQAALSLVNQWQFPITFVAGIITGNVGPWLFNKIRNRNKNKKIHGTRKNS